MPDLPSQGTHPSWEPSPDLQKPVFTIAKIVQAASSPYEAAQKSLPFGTSSSFCFISSCTSTLSFAFNSSAAFVLSGSFVVGEFEPAPSLLAWLTIIGAQPCNQLSGFPSSSTEYPSSQFQDIHQPVAHQWNNVESLACVLRSTV